MLLVAYWIDAMVIMVVVVIMVLDGGNNADRN